MQGCQFILQTYRDKFIIRPQICYNALTKERGNLKNRLGTADPEEKEKQSGETILLTDMALRFPFPFGGTPKLSDTKGPCYSRI